MGGSVPFPGRSSPPRARAGPGSIGSSAPAESGAEVALAGVEPVPVPHLAEAVAYLRGLRDPPPAHAPPEGDEQACVLEAPDLRDLRGQERARRALEIAAAGGHNLLLAGPPGTGKTMLARRLPGVLPLLDDEGALEVTRIHSVAGVLHPGAGLVRLRAVPGAAPLGVHRSGRRWGRWQRRPSRR